MSAADSSDVVAVSPSGNVLTLRDGTRKYSPTVEAKTAALKELLTDVHSRKEVVKGAFDAIDDICANGNRPQDARALKLGLLQVGTDDASLKFLISTCNNDPLLIAYAEAVIENTNARLCHLAAMDKYIMMTQGPSLQVSDE